MRAAFSWAKSVAVDRNRRARRSISRSFSGVTIAEVAAANLPYNEGMISRREFAQAGSLAALLAAQGRARRLSSIGVQLYTVRTVLPQEPAKVLGAIEAIGYQEVECTWAG